MFGQNQFGVTRFGEVPSGRFLTKILIETLTLTDTLIRQIGRLLVEIITYTDILQIARQFAKTLTEIMTWTDRVKKQIGRRLTEQFSLTDYFKRLLKRVPATNYKSLLGTLTQKITLSVRSGGVPVPTQAQVTETKLSTNQATVLKTTNDKGVTELE